MAVLGAGATVGPRFRQNGAMPNPALNDGAFQRATASQPPGSFTPGWGSPASELPTDVFEPGAAPGGPISGGPSTDRGTMTAGGTVTATAILLGIVMVAGWFGWQQVTVTELATRVDGTIERAIDFPAWVWIASLAGLPVAILTVFKPKLARFTGPLYAAAQGLFLGAISHVYDAQWDGIVLQAVLVTIAVFSVMLVLFATGTIKVTDRLRIAVVAATGAIFLTYLVSWIVSLFTSGVPFIHDAGPMGILFSLVVVGVAAFNLLLDFDLVQRGVAMRAPKYMEWYAAFGLMVTIIWLYLEILRLLSKLRQR